MSGRTCRWGILSTANIARKNWLAIKNTGNATITAVASRSLGKSEQFIQECQACSPFETAPQALGSYQELPRTARARRY
jgi:predicted dehydrogenase